MNSLEEREKAFENRFVHDANTHFNDTARRNKLLGEWAAGLLGMDEEEARSYSQAAVLLGVEDATGDALVLNLVNDLGNKAREFSIREKMDALLNEVVLTRTTAKLE